ncbi:MAG TPA: RNA polymerase sigma factor, partial [Polyangiaceae bacterium]
ARRRAGVGGRGAAHREVARPHRMKEIVDAVYRRESRRVLATLVRLLRDFDLAEEAMHEAFTAALLRWEEGGVPDNPHAWLVKTARFVAIDRMRGRARFDKSVAEMERSLSVETQPESELGQDVADDHLRLVFTCCHPSLPPDAQVALTLREVCGLSTEEIARAFLTNPATVAQRIVRAKAKIQADAIPYQIPAAAELPVRLDSVLRVVYLVFNEGYSASAGETLTRHELSGEAVRLGRLLLELLPEPEVMGLLALMLLHEARRPARIKPNGDVVLLGDQDRSLWDRVQIAEASSLVERALRSRRFGPYTLQAAIAAVHAEAADVASTDWPQIVGLYDVLLRVEPSPIVELNRALAVAMRDGLEPALAILDRIEEAGALSDYLFLHSARADLLRRLGRRDAALVAYRTALQLARQEPERRFLQRRIDELG